VLVGCGGTGAFLAEALCRLLIGRRGSLHLVDPDRVEPRNALRQAYAPDEAGRFKAEVLARRLARRFRRMVGYSVAPYDADLHAHVFGAAGGGLRLLVGAVDNAPARRAIAATLEARGWGPGRPGGGSAVVWMDLGNGRASGQVLVGNAARPEALRHAFDTEERLCRALPAPSLQRPELLDAPPRSEPIRDCAEAVALEEQNATVNQMMAALGAALVEKLLTGTLSWMAAYLDVDEGLLRPVMADPRAVAEIAGPGVPVVRPAARRAA
jgi:PRTRC genetic system ThiF family protein